MFTFLQKNEFFLVFGTLVSIYLYDARIILESREESEEKSAAKKKSRRAQM